MHTGTHVRKIQGGLAYMLSSSTTGAEGKSLRCLAGKGTELARCLLAYFAIPSSCSPYFLITQGREGRRRRRYGEGKGSQPASRAFEGLLALQTDGGGVEEGKARHFKIAFLLFEVRCRQQRKSSHIQTTDCEQQRTATSAGGEGRVGVEFDHGRMHPPLALAWVWVDRL